MDMKSHMLIFILKSMLVDRKKECGSYKIEVVVTLLGKMWRWNSHSQNGNLGVH
jgi:hypothetical protein